LHSLPPRPYDHSVVLSSAPPLALHALPTRRSSDLAALVMVSYFGSARSDLGRDLLMPALTAVVLGGANIYGGSGSVVGTALAALDRKSTRLNSSHVKISYAGFCLKKKTT